MTTGARHRHFEMHDKNERISADDFSPSEVVELTEAIIRDALKPILDAQEEDSPVVADWFHMQDKAFNRQFMKVYARSMLSCRYWCHEFEVFWRDLLRFVMKTFCCRDICDPRTD